MPRSSAYPCAIKGQNLTAQILPSAFLSGCGTPSGTLSYCLDSLEASSVQSQTLRNAKLEKTCFEIVSLPRRTTDEPFLFLRTFKTEPTTFAKPRTLKPRPRTLDVLSLLNMILAPKPSSHNLNIRCLNPNPIPSKPLFPKPHKPKAY